MHYLVKPHGDSLVTRIVSAILEDVTDRRGWRQPWDTFDDASRKRIIRHWMGLVKRELDAAALESK